MYQKKGPHNIKLPFREGVGMMIINKDNKVFVGQRVDTKMESWQMPQGGIELGETPSKAAMREMKEEIGTNNATIVAESKYWYYYNLPEFLIPKLWDGAYRGQRQKWFLIRHEGPESEIDVNTEMPEFSKWRWSNYWEVPHIIIPFKRKLYKAVINEFKIFLDKERNDFKD